MTFVFVNSIVILVFVGLGYAGNTGISNVLLHRNEGNMDAGLESNLFDITLGMFHDVKELIGDLKDRMGVKYNTTFLRAEAMNMSHEVIFT